MMIKAIGFIALIVLAGVGVFFVDRSQKRRALHHMEGRVSLSPAEFAKKYFNPSEAEIAEKLFHILARHLRIDLSKLYPDDDLVEELRMAALDSLSTEELIIDVEEEFSLKIPDREAQKISTFRGLVTYVVNATEGPTAA